jgi:hypothetical protein
VGVDGDLLVDGEGKRERGATCFRGDAGLRSGADGVEKVFELEAEGFAFGDVGAGEGEAGGGVYDGGERGRLGGEGRVGGRCRRCGGG